MTIGADLRNGSPSLLLPGIFSGSASSAMRAVERAALEVAPTDLPILVVGESGAGKGTLAAMIHRLSRRSKYELVEMNCRRISRTAVEGSSLSESRLGLSDWQLRGTLLLDEVLDLQPVVQNYVLNILPGGEDETNEAETGTAPRIIAVTSSGQGKRLSGSRFSRELYYRWQGVVLRIPPLRERKEDIPLLANFLLNKYASSSGRVSVRLSWRAEKRLQEHSWPGNVRELESVIKMLFTMDDEDLALECVGFPRAVVAPFKEAKRGHHHKQNSVEPMVSLKDAARTASRNAEKRLISKALERTRWNRKRAAQELNISYKALLYKVKQNGLESPSAPQDEQMQRGTAE